MAEEIAVVIVLGVDQFIDVPVPSTLYRIIINTFGIGVVIQKRRQQKIWEGVGRGKLTLQQYSDYD